MPVFTVQLDLNDIRILRLSANDHIEACERLLEKLIAEKESVSLIKSTENEITATRELLDRLTKIFFPVPRFPKKRKGNGEYEYKSINQV